MRLATIARTTGDAGSNRCRHAAGCADFCEQPRLDGWRCHLYRLAVHPSQRRRGVGSALLAAVEERFVRLGGRRGDAMVLKRNESAHHAWRAAGYTPEEHWRRWVKPLGE
ncbi:GNAT family N-acetyltransferase [Streptomyces pseudoechinosporeus]